MSDTRHRVEEKEMVATEFPIRYEDPIYQKTHRTLFSESLIAPLEEVVLPPGITRSIFDQVIQEFRSALGADGIYTGKALEDYVDPYELDEATGKRKIPSAAVCPRDTQELQAVLKIANKYCVPVWTFSRGKNLGYGGPAPRLNGSIALDLHRMNKIIEVNDEFAYAVVEPGVTFTDLYNHCAANKLRVWPSVPSLGWGSVVGNTLDRGTGFTPTASHHQNIAGLEVMLSNGDVVRTGQFAITSSPSAHLSKFTFGPSIEGLFLQSNLAVVTKMGIWLTPQPQAYLSCSFSMPNFEDVETVVSIFGELRRNGLLPSTVYVSNIIEWIGMMGKREEFWDGPGPIPDWRVKELQQKLGMGYWNAKFGLYGHRQVIQAHFDELKKIIGVKAPEGRLYGEMFSAEDHQLLDPLAVPEPHGGMFVGVPSLWSLPMVKYRLPKDGSGIGAHADYSPIIPSDGKTIAEWLKKSKEVCESRGFDLFCDFFMHERHVIFVNMLCFDKSNPEHRESVNIILHQLFEEGRKRGFSAYRTHINYMDLVADVYDFNDHAYRRFVETLKDSLDPNGILSPGKQGIWGRRFRKYRDDRHQAKI